MRLTDPRRGTPNSLPHPSSLFPHSVPSNLLFRRARPRHAVLPLGCLPLPHRLFLLPLLPLRIPLPRLQHQDTQQHERQDGVTRRHDLQAILAFPILLRTHPILSLADGPHPRHNVSQVHGDATHVEHKTRAVEEHVRLRGLVQLEEEAEEADEDDDVQDALDQRGGVVQEGDVGGVDVESGGGEGGGGGP